MLVKTITYVDYNGEERTEEFRFNLNQSELTEMEFSINGGMTQLIEKITREQDGKELMKMFKTIIMKAYGEKSLDGRRFVKSQEISEAFAQTEAYNQLFMSFFDDSNNAIEFINGILPTPTEGKVRAIPQTNA